MCDREIALSLSFRFNIISSIFMVKYFGRFSNVMANKYLNARGCIIAVATGIFVNVIIQLLQQLVDDTF